MGYKADQIPGSENRAAAHEAGLKSPSEEVRLESLKRLMEDIEKGILPKPPAGTDVNNHIHTIYSFSPYAPAEAVWRAMNAGLSTAGIMDHDSVSGAQEFLKAGEITGLSVTVGVECRADFSGTRVEGRRLNNPDQNTIAYMALHGIPHTRLSEVAAFFKPLIDKRNARNRKMVERINGFLEPFKLSISFDEDVAPLSQADKGGSVTERHVLYALSLRLIAVYGKGPSLVSFLKDKLALPVSGKLEGFLTDEANPHYSYDLLGLLKSSLVERFYIPATDECPPVAQVLELADRVGAISAYAYLGDVGDSVTGDKKTQTFEDSYLELLFEELYRLGFKAITYMPSRNTLSQMDRVRGLCDKYGFLQISGEDINSSRQSFVCEAIRNDYFKNLIDTTWALIGHELAATGDLTRSMFSAETIRKYPSLNERIKAYKVIGLEKGREGEV